MKLRPSTKGWLGLAAYVVVWDLLAEETLSSGFADAWRHPVRRWPLVAAWAFITAHLFVVLPERIDPLRGLARRTR